MPSSTHIILVAIRRSATAPSLSSKGSKGERILPLSARPGPTEFEGGAKSRAIFSMAGELGFEPRLTESQFAVLPLNYSPMAAQIADNSYIFNIDKSDI